MKNKLEFLLNKANIGIYTKCEVIEIFGFNKEANEAFNIYTLIVFENTKQENMEEMLTEKLQFFKGYTKISWGIQRRVVEITELKQLYIQLFEKNEYQLDKPLNVGKLKLLPEQYVPLRESRNKSIQINNILKNNFHNGSYILEFFDEEKNNIQFLLDNPILLNDFSEQVNSVLPIKIGTLSDRLGNIIFQLPINSVEIHHSSIVDRTVRHPKFQGFEIEIFPKINSFNIKNLLIRIYEEDETITRHQIVVVKDKVTEILLDDSFATYIEIIDKDTQLLLYRFKVYLMKEGYVNFRLMEPQKRVFVLNGQKKQLEVDTNAGNSVHGKIKDKAFNEWIQDRKYEEQLKELEKSKAFIQYFGNEEKKALREVRELINQYGEKGVYIWDPYLSAIDIKNTLYFSKTTYIPLRAITGLGNRAKRHEREQFKENMIDEFKKDDKQFLFLNLEVRGKIGTGGYKFHDRFLIFPLEKPKVWSLGISVNQLGKSHHILQEVKNAQHILNAFNKLWDELNDKECLVWKSK